MIDCAKTRTMLEHSGRKRCVNSAPTLTTTRLERIMADDTNSGNPQAKSTRRKHGCAERGKMTREYRIWSNMRARCSNPKASHYERYGGRGISICARWDDFSSFLSDMGPCPSASHSLDRIDNDGDYSPENCRWATRHDQMNNSSRIRRVVFQGVELPITEAIRRAGLNRPTFYKRISAGWSFEDALHRPARPRRKAGEAA